MWRRNDSHQRKHHGVSRGVTRCHIQRGRCWKVGHFSSHSNYDILVTWLGGHTIERYTWRSIIWRCWFQRYDHVRLNLLYGCVTMRCQIQGLFVQCERGHHFWPFIWGTVTATQYSTEIHKIISILCLKIMTPKVIGLGWWTSVQKSGYNSGSIWRRL